MSYCTLTTKLISSIIINEKRLLRSLILNKLMIVGEAMVLDYEKIMVLGADKQLTLKELLNAAKIARITAKRIKDGETVTMKTAGKLAAVLGVSVADLLQNKT